MSIQGIGQDYIPQGVKVEVVKPAETTENTPVAETAQPEATNPNKDIVLPFGHSVESK